ncbi:hypothetical protein Q5752_000992 [Cryptotrichosporon argae]
MGIRTRQATPGTLLCLAATACLAVVAFNTPLLTSLYFLEATFDSGTYNGTIKLGTLGYCITSTTSTCVGPKVGYEFDLNTIFDVTVFDIPTAVSKYLTYCLVLHIIALGFAAAATVFGLLSHISTLSLLCFPTCTASLASSFALLSLIFDLVIFYIAKARIDDVSGASASIGQSVWLTLAAWLLAGLSGCAYSLGRCCGARRDTREPGDSRYPAGKYQPASSTGPDEMRLHAIRDEQLRQKEAGLPGFTEAERAPLAGADDAEDKYLYEDAPATNTNGLGRPLRRDGSVLQGVGVGYGRRGGARAGARDAPDGPGYPPGAYPASAYGDSVVGAGAAGIGAGPAGVDAPPPPQQQRGYGYDGYGQSYEAYPDQGQDYYANNANRYDDPYAPQPDAYDYGASQGYDQQQLRSAPTPAPPAHLGPHDYYTGPNAAQGYDARAPSHAQPQQGYEYDDGDGLGAIGRAATSPTQAYGAAGYYAGAGTGSSNNPARAAQQQAQANSNLHVPQPQHLVDQTRSDLLRSPVDHAPDGYAYDHHAVGRPPSYGDIAGQAAYAPPEKGR